MSSTIRRPGARPSSISVLDFEQFTGRTRHDSADAVIPYVCAEEFTIDWLLERHAHADHLFAASNLKEQLGGTLALGSTFIEGENDCDCVGLRNDQLAPSP
jgi:hypothetical protein